MPSRIRKKGNKWYYRIEIPDGKGGKKYTERVAGTTKKSAELAYWHAIEKNIAEGPFISPSAMTVSKYLEMWISDYVEINLRETTIKSYKSAIKYHINPAIGNVKIGVVCPKFALIIIGIFSSSFFVLITFTHLL